VSALLAPPLLATPQAPVITYGLVRDGYGRPLVTSATSPVLELVKSADRAGRVYARCTVGDSGIVGMNYRLSLEIDSEGPNRDNAVVKGTEMFVRAMVGSSEKALSPVATFVTPEQGAQQRLDFTLGTDADGDGMPDEWEAWVLDEDGRDSSAAAVAAFRPGDDADGDGMTNLQEYLAGTDPFIATDILKIVSFERIAGTDRAKVTFTTVRNRKYRIVMSESLDKPNWSPVATSDSTEGELAYEPMDGTGRMRTVHVDVRLNAMFLRVAVN